MTLKFRRGATATGGVTTSGGATPGGSSAVSEWRCRNDGNKTATYELDGPA